jgi:hypothetical protein
MMAEKPSDHVSDGQRVGLCWKKNISSGSFIQSLSFRVFRSESFVQESEEAVRPA